MDMIIKFNGFLRVFRVIVSTKHLSPWPTGAPRTQAVGGPPARALSQLLTR